jgi:hypothetical protein
MVTDTLNGDETMFFAVVSNAQTTNSPPATQQETGSVEI